MFSLALARYERASLIFGDEVLCSGGNDRFVDHA